MPGTPDAAQATGVAATPRLARLMEAREQVRDETVLAHRADAPADAIAPMLGLLDRLDARIEALSEADVATPTLQRRQAVPPTGRTLMTTLPTMAVV